MKAILPKFNLQGRIDSILTNKLNKVSKDYSKRIINDFNDTTRNFNTVKPTFQFRIASVFPNFEWVVEAKNDKSGEIYTYLDLGTSKRFVVMTPNFQSKSLPNSVYTRKGIGGFSHFVREPLPGIEARNFSELIAKNHTSDVQKFIQESIFNVLKKRYYG